MQSLRIKLDETTNYSNSSRSKISNKHTSNKKSIQVVQQKIDNHLQKTYERLRLDAEKQQKGNKSPLRITQSNKENVNSNNDGTSKNFMKHISLKRRDNLSANGYYSTPFTKQSQKIIEKDGISLLDNRDIIEYIQLIYETYNIKDPLNDQQNSNDIDATESTISKNRINGEECDQQDSLNSARTTKPYVENIVQISQFDVDKQTHIKKITTTKKNNKILITLRAKTANKKCVQHSLEKKVNPLLVFKDKEANISNLCSKKPHKKQKIEESEYPTFRYCFACEKPILEENISRHQSTCHQLRQAYKFNFAKIIKILDQKMERIMGQIDRQIINKNAVELTQRFQSLQQTIKTWMRQILRIKNRTNDANEQSTLQEYRGTYQLIKQNLNHNFYDSFEKLNKLNWFAKLRNNIIKKFHLF